MNVMRAKSLLQGIWKNVSSQLTYSSTKSRCCSYDTGVSYGDRDPAPYFFNEHVQVSLKKLTGTDYEKVFRPQRPGTPFKKPRYKFLTKEMLQRELSEIDLKTAEFLQMPPVLLPRKEINHVFTSDGALTGYDESKFVFTDTSLGLNDANRLIVVRDLNGVLRKAYWHERERCLNIYFPTEGRKLTTPKMFSDEYLQDLLERGEYEFILNRACIQFEPDDSEYLRVTHQTYQHIDKAAAYDKLWSTRHYGPLVFYLTWMKMADMFLLHLLKYGRIQNAEELVRLFCYLHHITELSVEEYISKYSSATTKHRLELAIKQGVEVAQANRT